MAEDQSHQHDYDKQRSARRPAEYASAPWRSQETSPETSLTTGEAPDYPHSLLDSPLQARGNGPIRAAMAIQAQQTYGNRALQRWLKSRQAPRSPRPPDTTQAGEAGGDMARDVGEQAYFLQRVVVQRMLPDEKKDDHEQQLVVNIQTKEVFKITAITPKKVYTTRNQVFAQYGVSEYRLEQVAEDGSPVAEPTRKTVRSDQSADFFLKSDPALVKKETELKEAREAAQKGEGGFLHGEDLFPGKTVAEGTFEYVAQYLYDSVSDVNLREKIWRQINKRAAPGAIPEAEQSQILQEMIQKAYIPFDKIASAQELAGQTPKDLTDLYQLYTIQAADASELQGLDSVGVGFHATSGKPDEVKDKPKPEGGWEGIKKPGTVDFFRKRYALDAPWNPLAAYFQKHKANFRLGKNKDNDLLSTVSVALRMYPALKFPFPKGKERMQGTNLYAVVVKKGYPTFVQQRALGEDRPFPEIAVDDVSPEDIVGYAFVSRWYPGGKDDDDKAQFAADFEYKVYDFIVNTKFHRQFTQPVREKLIQMAQAEVDKHKASDWQKWKP